MRKQRTKPPRIRLAAVLAGILGCNLPAQADTAVTVCSDDLVPGTLRSAVASAVDGAVIDVSACSKITLAHGEIATSHSITIRGPEIGRATQIDANYSSRVLRGTSSNATITLTAVSLENGFVHGAGSSAYGGCILAAGALELQHSIVTHCSATSDSFYASGGAVAAHKVTLHNSRIDYSAAAAYGDLPAFGGGASTYAGFYCYSSTVHRNSVSGPGGGAIGGGVQTYDGPTVVDGCTIDGNYSSGYDGGIAQFGAGKPLGITNSTISGNTAPLGIGAVYAAGPLTILNSTIAYNRSSEGPCAGAVAAAAAHIESSIIAHNVDDGTGCGDVESAQVPTGGNIIITKLGSTMPRGTLVTDPKLTPLGFHGGSTQTHGLSLGSPAIDLGNSAASLDFDQRGAGFARVVGGRADMGAYERQAGDEELFYGGFE